MFEISVDGAKITGTSSSDTFIGTGSSVSIDSGAGDDYIQLSGKKATISAGAGDDIIISEGGQSYISGGAGDDSIVHTGLLSTIDGGPGNDLLVQRGRNGLIRAGEGSDTVVIQNRLSLDTVEGSPNSTIVMLSSDSSVVYLYNGGADTILGYKDSNDVIIIPGSDTYVDTIMVADTISVDSDTSYTTGYSLIFQLPEEEGGDDS